MELPEALTASINQVLEGIPLQQLKKSSFALSESYREKKKVRGVDLYAYLAARLPATYAAQRRVLDILKTHLPESFTTLTDFGAGPGIGTWAVSATFEELKEAKLVEINPDMISLGNKLGFPQLHVEWSQEITTPSDLVLFSYSFGELSPENQVSTLNKAWEMTQKALVLIEPGTPSGYENILRARKQLIDLGAHLLAPCPHSNICSLKMPSYPQKDDWCHFSITLPRSFIHRYVKEGDLGFEDEKFSYIIVSKIPGIPTKARILRDPEKRSSHINLFLCTPLGIQKKTFSKRHAEYKSLRKAKWGDELKYD